MITFRGRFPSRPSKPFAGWLTRWSERNLQGTSSVSPGRWLRSALSFRSIAGEGLVLLIVIIVLLVSAGIWTLVSQTRHDHKEESREKVVSVAEAIASSPGIRAALHARNPSRVLQPRAEEARRRTHVAFVVVMNPEGMRYTHPDTAKIGKRYSGHLGSAAEGRTFTEYGRGAFGPVVRAVAPVTGADGSVVGLVAVGITVNEATRLADDHLPEVLGGAAIALSLAIGGATLIGARLRRQTHGLGPAEITRMYEHHDAVLHSVREGVVIIDSDRRVLLVNDEAQRLLDLPPDTQGHFINELGLPPDTAELFTSGRHVADEVHLSGDRLLAVSQQPTDWRGQPLGTVATLRDTTELRMLAGKSEMAQENLKLMYDASTEIGTTLSVTRTAEELAQVAVPQLADFVTIDLPDAVLSGEDPIGDGSEMRRAAVHGIQENSPLYPVGELIRFLPSTPHAQGFESGRAVIEPELKSASGWMAQHPEHCEQILSYGIHSLITVPLRARGVMLGVASFWRATKPPPFHDDDLFLAKELCAHAAVCIDNARRYTREHTTSVALQRSLLPQGLPDHDAVEAAYHYRPAHTSVSGDWFDIIPLSGARVALVVGDVVGHGLHAAATMGRLRTAVHNFSALDLPPDELLNHLDDLVSRLDQDEEGTPAGSGNGVIGATCLYAVYDPTSGHCAMARAGHPPPAIVQPDGTAGFPDLPAGPPLGLGGSLFEAADFALLEGSQLVLYTDGLIEDRQHDIDTGLQQLCKALAHPGRSPEETCDAVLTAMVPARPSDDIALLVARTRTLAAGKIARWDLPADPAAVPRLRAAVAHQLAEWGLGDAAFATELVVTELATNAVRYGAPPLHVRLLHNRSLICEVSDASSTSPHLRRARATDEGGRGLFLVAQLTDHWGTRYTINGKVIWTEQLLPS
ncbi:SpoIIE family protein phosphatase [Streptomyces sioyaensis]|uniref:SpoIIE family protein phosphatase n=1 Tax=Streptomyces sioyaensis TaxID=67364 RepID=UPI0036F04992